MTEEQMLTELGVDGTKWLNECYNGLDINKIIDVHTHICGVGTNDSGCYIYRKMNSPFRHPFLHLKKRVLFNACGVDCYDENADLTYVQNLIKMIRNNKPPQSNTYPKSMILAFDAVYDINGNLQSDATGMYTPNDWIFQLTKTFPDCFLPVCSIHPYRKDALHEMERCHQLGARMIKWLPNSMGIDPENPICLPFYQKMTELNMVLLSHAGDENSVSSDVLDQTLGNPLRLSLALDTGVKVIVAHCASEGCNCSETNNLSVSQEGHKPKQTENFDLFMEMMKINKYKDLLFGDISALLTFRRVKYLQTLLDTPEIHNRLYFGTDYPVPCISLVTLTSVLLYHKLITTQERQWLNIVYKYNVLLFDFCAKRTIKSPLTGQKFQDIIFQHNI